MHTSRVEWERSWQRDFDRNFPHGATPPKHTRPIPPSLFAAMGSDKNIFGIEYEESLICKLQHDIGVEAAKRCAEDGFEDAWRALPDDRRRELVLEGIYRTLCIPDMDERRKWCPDSSLESLEPCAHWGEKFEVGTSTYAVTVTVRRPTMRHNKIRSDLSDRLDR